MFESKITKAIVAEAYRLFGKNPETTTEAELHQAMTEAAEGIQDQGTATDTGADLSALTAELQTAKNDLATAKAELQAAETAKQQAEADKATAEQAIADAKAEAAKLQKELQAANEALAAKVGEMRTLAAEVARLTAKKLPEDLNANDDAEHLEASPAGGGVTIKTGINLNEPLAAAKHN